MQHVRHLRVTRRRRGYRIEIAHPPTWWHVLTFRDARYVPLTSAPQDFETADDALDWLKDRVLAGTKMPKEKPTPGTLAALFINIELERARHAK